MEARVRRDGKVIDLSKEYEVIRWKRLVDPMGTR